MSEGADSNKIIGKKQIVGIAFLAVLMFFSVKWILMQKTEYNWISAGYVSAFCYFAGILGLLLSVFYIFLIGTHLDACRVFLILYLVLGMAYMAVSPLSSVPDETEHMLRAYGITLGDFVPPVNDAGEGGSFVPDNLTYQWDRSGARLSYMRHNIMMEASGEKTFAVYSNTAFYSPLTYLPQSLGILAARMVCNKPYVIAYTGRMFELIASGILIYYAIKLMPFGKNILLVLSLLPMNMYECASLSGDGMAYAVTILIIAYCMWLRYERNDKIRKREIAYLYILLALVASCKIVYAPFVLMAFIIPAERFRSKKAYITHIVCAGIMIFALAVVWPVGIGSRYLLEYTEGVSSSEQLIYVLTHPLRFIQIMFFTVIAEGEWLFKTYFAASLSYFSVECNILVIFISAAGLFYACFADKIVRFEDESNIKLWKRPVFILGAATLLSIVFTFLSLYIEWTPYRAGSVEGLQGRYFIPLTFQSVYLIKRKSDMKPADERGDSAKASVMPIPAILVCMANLMVIITLFVYYI